MADNNENQSYDFFGLVKITNRYIPSHENELESFLKNYSRNINILISYPTVLDEFLRYNSGLPSSTPEERLFSVTAGNVMTK